MQESMQRGRSMASEFNRWRYDVFLSFRGDDTRQGFTSHLFDHLTESGVNTFMDTILQRGEDISSQLIDTIRSSRIAVVIFSRNYANSSWCLQELSEIMERRISSPGQVVLPVFYGVDPSDVRNQTGNYGEAFAKHENNKPRETLDRWRAALTNAANLSGLHLNNFSTESELKKAIAKRVHELKNTILHVPKHLVGLRSQIDGLSSHLNDSYGDVRFLMISGMGGIGKTTLADELFNQFSPKFEAKCFLHDVRENAEQPNGLVHLQELLLRDTLKVEFVLVNVDRGINVIKDRLASRRVLIVLDDMENQQQLKALAGERLWFGPGSRIIITTRNKLLGKEINPEGFYMINPLSDDDSQVLFKRHAFQGGDLPGNEFNDLAREIVSYCQGLPLALEILGARLKNESERVWEDLLERLRRIPEDEIQKRLELSYESLGVEDKKIFLDVACFFVGLHYREVVAILKACDLSGHLGLNVLRQRNLIRFTWNNKLEMHDLIRDMEKDIVCRESRDNPGLRSRLSSDTDICRALESNLGTENVRGIVSNNPLMSEVNSEAFKNMKLLMLLKLNELRVNGDYSLISKELRWLCLHGFPLEFLPNELSMSKLGVLDMRHSNLRGFWKKSSKSLGQLKVLNLSNCERPVKTPDFSKLPNLMELIMESCKNLQRIDGSIGCLQGLIRVNLRNCKKLKDIPDSICKVKSLQVLDIHGCTNIKYLPYCIGSLESLKVLDAAGVPIIEVPSSIKDLINLVSLSLGGYYDKPENWFCMIFRVDNSSLKATLDGLSSLRVLQLTNCSTSLKDISKLRNLVMLRFYGCHFSRFPYRICENLLILKQLHVLNCPKLETLPKPPPGVHVLVVSDCDSLVYIFLGATSPHGPQASPEIHLQNCPKLEHVDGNRNLRVKQLTIIGCPVLWTKCGHLMWKFGQVDYISLLPSNIPSCFEQRPELPLPFEFPRTSCSVCEDRIFILYVVQKHRHDARFSNLELTSITRGCKIDNWSMGCFEGDNPPNANYISIRSTSLSIEGIREGAEVTVDVDPSDYLSGKIRILIDRKKCKRHQSSPSTDEQQSYPLRKEQWLLRSSRQEDAIQRKYPSWDDSYLELIKDYYYQ